MIPSAIRLLAAVAAVASLSSGSPAFSQETGGDIEVQFADTMTRLTMKVPLEFALQEPIRQPLTMLVREKCDQEAIKSLGKALEETGYKRDAAMAHMSFSAGCGGHGPSLRAAINILLGISDYVQASMVATDLIKLEPMSDNGYFLRAISYEKTRQPKNAIGDYLTAIELFGSKERISSVSYVGLAKAYEALGQYCDAISPIEAWVGNNPARNDNSQTRAIIAGYRQKGNCPAGEAARVEVFSGSPSNGVNIVPVIVNGVKGSFILDTGASNVTMSASFAAKAGVSLDKSSVIYLQTANGVTQGYLGRAATVQLRSLKTTNVQAVVQSGDAGGYGRGIDGLLGMSFLSRFQVTIDGSRIKVAAREGTAAKTTAPQAASPVASDGQGAGAGAPSESPAAVPAAPKKSATATKVKPKSKPNPKPKADSSPFGFNF